MLQVAVRCRPFTYEDKLGVVCRQRGDHQAEVEMVNGDRSMRVPFTYAWWSGYGYQRKIKSPMRQADEMTLVDQQSAYDQVGADMKLDLCTGNAVVLFAYGLSGSGKTFTVFGPDGIDDPRAWFNFATPQPSWGVFPRLAYELYNEHGDGRSPGFGVSIKYFQNVHDTVRDLLSPVAVEKHFKEGMRQDEHGFADITWCRKKVLQSWESLRQVIGVANRRKCLAPTQFNHCSTRGHCILVYEVSMMDSVNLAHQHRGRLYLCDLAGAEPAGDIVYAEYKREELPDGSIEYIYKGPHPDQEKTTQMREQGKKINLSLSELTMFFRRLALKIKAKKFKPGQDLPGCNAYFLGKYLKKTILQAKTYLIAAVRPEVQFHKYTHATLEFARNASVVQLQPKKPASAQSAEETHLMSEIEQFRRQQEELERKLQHAEAEARTKAAEAAALQNENIKLHGDEEHLSQQRDELSQARDRLAAKVKELEDHLNSEASQQLEQIKEQQEMYRARGILMAHEAEDLTDPFLEELDEDEFRNKRFVFPLSAPVTRIGRSGDVRPTNFTITEKHCVIKRERGEIILVGGLGPVYVNGKRIRKDVEIGLIPLDRIIFGDCMTMLRWHNHEDRTALPLTARQTFAEFQKGQSRSRSKQRRASVMLSDAGSIAHNINKRMTELAPRVEEVNGLLNLLDRSLFTCEHGIHYELNDALDANAVPKLKVQVDRKDNGDQMLLDLTQFNQIHGILKRELTTLHAAIVSGSFYEIPANHVPFALFYDQTFALGANTMPLAETVSAPAASVIEADTRSQVLKGIQAPHNAVGNIHLSWRVLLSPMHRNAPQMADDTPVGEAKMLQLQAHASTSSCIGKPWRCALRIHGISDINMEVTAAYCQYTFHGETFTTETVETRPGEMPQFDFEHVHEVSEVSEEFLEYLERESLHVRVIVKCAAENPCSEPISTNNARVVDNIKNAFRTVVELRSEATILTNEARDQALAEVNSVIDVTEDQKSAARAALLIATTDEQRRAIMSCLRRGLSPEEIQAAGTEAAKGHTKHTFKELNRVRSVIGMLSHIQKDTHEMELEHDLDAKVAELDETHRMITSLERQHKAYLAQSAGALAPDASYCNMVIAEVERLPAVTADERERNTTVINAIHQSTTMYEVDVLRHALLVQDADLTEVKTLIANLKKQVRPITEQERVQRQQEIAKDQQLSRPQRAAALEALATAQFSYQVDALMKLVLVGATAQSISTSISGLERQLMWNSESSETLVRLRRENQQHEDLLCELRQQLQQTTNSAIREKAALQSEVENLGEQVKDARKQMHRQVDDSKRGQAQMQARMQQTLADIGEMSSFVAGAESQVASAQEAMAKQRRELDEAKEEVERLHTECERVTQELDGMREASQLFKTEAATSAKTLRKEMQATRRAADNRASQMQKELKVLRREGEEKAAALSRVQYQLQQIEQQHAGAMEDVERLESDISEREKRVADGEAEIESLRDQLSAERMISGGAADERDEAQKQLAVAIDKVAKLQSELERAAASSGTAFSAERKKRQEVDAECLKLTAHVASLEREKIELGGEVQRVRSDLEVAQKSSEDLAEQLQAAESKHDEESTALSTELRTLRNETTDLQLKMEQETKSVEYVTQRFQSKIDSLSAALKAARENQGKILDLTRELEQVKDDSEMAKARFARMAQESDDTIKQLRNDLQSSEKVAVDADTQIHTLKLSLQDTQARMQQAQKRLAPLEAERATLFENVKSCRAQLKEAESDQRALEQQLEARNQEHQQAIQVLQRKQEQDSQRLNELHEASQQELDEAVQALREQQEHEVQALRQQEQKLHEEGQLALNALRKRLEQETQHLRLQWSDEVQELRRQMKNEMEAVHAQHETELEALRQQHSAALKEKVSAIRSLKEDAIQAADTKALDEAHDRINTLQCEVRDLVQKVARAEELKEKARTDLGKLRSSTAEVAHREEHLNSQIANANAERREAMVQANALRSEVASLRAKAAQAVVYETDLAETRAQMEAVALRHNEQFTEMQKSLHRAKADCQAHEAARFEASAQHRVDSARLEQQLSIVRGQLSELEKRSEQTLRSKCDSHETQLQQLRDEITTSKAHAAAMETDMARLRSEHHSEIMRLQVSVTEEAEKILSAEREHNAGESARLRQQIDSLQNHANTMAERMKEAWLEERTRLRNDLEQARNSALHLQRQLQNRVLQLDRDKVQRELMAGELRAERNALKENREEMARQKAAIAKARADQDTITRLQRALADAQRGDKHAWKLEREASQLSSENAKLKAENKALESRLNDQGNSSRVSESALLHERVQELRAQVLEKGQSETEMLLQSLTADRLQSQRSSKVAFDQLLAERSEHKQVTEQLKSENRIAMQKVAQLTQVLRRAQDSWSQERRDLIAARDMAQQSAADAATKLSRVSAQMEESKLVQSRTTRPMQEREALMKRSIDELRRSRMRVQHLQEANEELLRETGMLRTEVASKTARGTAQLQTSRLLRSELDSVAQDLDFSKRHMTPRNQPAGVMPQYSQATRAASKNARLKSVERALHNAESKLSAMTAAATRANAAASQQENRAHQLYRDATAAKAANSELMAANKSLQTRLRLTRQKAAENAVDRDAAKLLLAENR